MGRTAETLRSAHETAAPVVGRLAILLETQRDLKRLDVAMMARRLHLAADKLEELIRGD